MDPNINTINKEEPLQNGTHTRDNHNSELGTTYPLFIYQKEKQCEKHTFPRYYHL